MALYTLPALDYAFDSLEPFIDTTTMEIHYTKHHQAYVDKLNAALTAHPALQSSILQELLTSLDTLPADCRQEIRNNGGGHFNHSFFWKLMTPSSKPLAATSPLYQAVIKKFGSLESMKKHINAAGLQQFGSGWGWLVVDKQAELAILSTANQDTPLASGLVPVIAIDVWEHAYYLRYTNRRADYLQAWWSVLNWSTAEEHYLTALQKI